MEDIDKARAIRDFILSNDRDAEWGSTVFGDAEHQCWHLRGRGWRATTSTLWDVMNARGRHRDVHAGDAFELSRKSIIEVFAVEDDSCLLGMSYGSEPSEDLLFAYDGNGCRKVFMHLLALTEVDHGHRARGSTIIYRRDYAA